MIKLLVLVIVVTFVFFLILKLFKKLFLVLFLLLAGFGLYTCFGWEAIVQDQLPYPKPLRAIGLFFFPSSGNHAKI